MKPSKSKIQIWNRLVEEVFNHPKSKYSLFVYELCRRRILGTTKKEFREIGHDLGIKDIKGYFDFDDNSQQDNTEDKGNTSPSPPPRKKDESLEGGCDEDSLAPADTILKSGETNREI